MAVEIERKFLVDHSLWQTFKSTNRLEGIPFKQGYLSEGQATVRVRIKGDTGAITVKGKTVGLSRLEFEYEVPLADADEMLTELCNKPLIDKHRYFYREGDFTWEVDEFHGENEGLILAEIELPAEDAEFNHPEWLREDVSGDGRYYNVSLTKKPFSAW